MRWEKIDKNDYLLAFLVWFATFTVYFLTLGVSIGFEDFAEFQTAAYVLGVPHAPGYPLIVLWGKLFTFLPFGSIAYRVNLSNAVISSAACSFLFIMLRKFTFQKVLSLSLAIAFGLTTTYWSQSVMVEVYTMAVLFFLIMFYYVQNWKSTEQLKDIYLFAFFSGLGVTAHYTNALNFIVLLFYLLYKDRFTKIPFKNWCIAAIFFFCGLLPFIYLPIASSFNPIINVGETSNLTNFINHLMRKHFDTLEFATKVTYYDKLMFVKYLMMQLWSEFYIGVAFALVGLLYLWKKDKEFFLISLFLFFVNSFIILFTLQYPAKPKYVFNIRVYYFCAFAIFTIWIAFFINFLYEKIQTNTHTKISKNLRRGILSLLYLLVLVYPLFLLAINYNTNDRSKYYVAYNYAKDILSSLEKNAILFTSITTEIEFPIAYLVGIEKYRPDITVYSQTGMIFENIYRTTTENSDNEIQEAIKRVEWALIRKGERPIYYDDSTAELPPGYKVLLYGLVYKVVPQDNPSLPDLNIWENFTLPNKEISSNTQNYDFLTKNVLCRYLSYRGYSYQLNKMIEEAIQNTQKLLKSCQIMTYHT
ncbi:MAG: DUF2723 domain-containing protein [Leptospiraceae bacterium]|nr:DUF2723 domain-containing protein [Leptospiraceae bacterium]